MSIRWFNKNRAISAVAGTAVFLGAVALVMRLARAVHGGRGIVPYRTAWGYETTPLTALISVGVTLLVLGCAVLARHWSKHRSSAAHKRRPSSLD